MVRLAPGVTRPDEESVVKEKHVTLLRNGNRRIAVTLGDQQTLSLENSLGRQPHTAHNTGFCTRKHLLLTGKSEVNRTHLSVVNVSRMVSAALW